MKVPAIAQASAGAGNPQGHKAGLSHQRQAKTTPLAAPKAVPKQTHADLMADMRQAEEPLSVGGESCWNDNDACLQLSVW